MAIALAYRKSYNHENYRNGGIIWIAPNKWINPSEYRHTWKEGFPKWEAKPKHLRSVLIHEIGHIFGMPHIPGSIMI